MENKIIYRNVILSEVVIEKNQNLHLLDVTLWDNGLITMTDSNKKDFFIRVEIYETPNGINIKGKGAKIYRKYIEKAYETFTEELLNKGLLMNEFCPLI